MSNDIKRIFKPLGKFIIIRSVGEIKKNSILVPTLGTHQEHRQWEDNENTINAVGDEVTKVKIGDKVLLDAHTKLRKIEKITKIVEEKLGVQFTAEIKDSKGSLITTEEKEKFFAVREEDVVCIIY